MMFETWTYVAFHCVIQTQSRKPIRLQKLTYRAEKEKVAAATMLQQKFERSERLLERLEQVRRNKIARNNTRYNKVIHNIVLATVGTSFHFGRLNLKCLFSQVRSHHRNLAMFGVVVDFSTHIASQ